MAARVWCFQPAPGQGLYRCEPGMQHTNSRIESISNSRLESMISFGFLEGDRTGHGWLRFHSESVETGLAMAPRRVHVSMQLRAERHTLAQHGRSGPGAAAAPG
jgi:hypothetical protein